MFTSLSSLSSLLHKVSGVFSTAQRTPPCVPYRCVAAGTLKLANRAVTQRFPPCNWGHRQHLFRLVRDTISYWLENSILIISLGGKNAKISAPIRDILIQFRAAQVLDLDCETARVVQGPLFPVDGEQGTCVAPTGSPRSIWSTQWDGNCRNKGAVEQFPRLALAHGVTAHRCDTSNSALSPLSSYLTAGDHAEKGGEEPLAPEMENKKVVAFCLPARSAKILQ